MGFYSESSDTVRARAKRCPIKHTMANRSKRTVDKIKEINDLDSKKLDIILYNSE